MSPRKNDIPESVKIIGANIKSIIKEKNLKVRHVAHDADLDIENFRKYMAGTQIMGIDKLTRITKALNVEISALFEGI
ncbi:MAG: helix-turn-helix transcriptional regulator [Flavobacterium sp.]|nr:helix-turn-helix transcriptional regulator [Flavobacterium sp.]